MEDKIILHLCADIGSDSKPYREAGYDVRLIGSDIGVENYHPPENVYGIIANPVCTMLSWCRTNAKTPRNLEEGMFLVKECLRIIWESQYKLLKPNSKLTTLKFWMIENPSRGFLYQFLGKPLLKFQPYEYGDTYKKETAIWGNFNIPKKTPIDCNAPKFDQLASKDIHPEMFGKLTRTERRSMCSPGFANAFFKANR
ncbi:MAG: hypothetical protein GY793_02800 [Proteobacteria bacterium]|nr:hypothetical protein [Pseudomonadota bacterium]